MATVTIMCNNSLITSHTNSTTKQTKQTEQAKNTKADKWNDYWTSGGDGGAKWETMGGNNMWYI